MNNERYTGKDVVEIAVQAKARGVELYMMLARNSENYHVSNLFAELAKKEEKHKLELKKWLDYLSKEKREEAYPGEKSLYLKALVDSNTFNCDKQKTQLLETTISEEEALQAGITFEKDFILFLHDIKRHIADKEDSIVDSLIEEEINHLSEMFHLKDKIAKGEK